MNDDRTLERAARSWLEAGPTQAPGRAVEAALLRIQTLPQERDLRIPWRLPTMTTPARLATAAVIGALAVGGAFLFVSRPAQPSVGTPVATPSPTPTPTTTPSASAAALLDWSNLPGRILVEHLGNAPTLTEVSADYHPEKRRFFFMDPKDMNSGTITEFLPGTPTTGKSAADISSDGRRIVFQDYTDRPSLYEANLDGTGFRRIPVNCTCQLLYPDYDPTASRIVYVRMEGDQSWLETLDLATNKITKLTSTVGPSADAVPEQPAWSPDGSTIVFSRITWGTPNEPDVGTVHFGDRAPLSGTLSLLDVASGKVSDITTPAAIIAGDPNWSPDSATIVFAAAPNSTTGGVSASMPKANWAIGRDGAGLTKIAGLSSPEYLPGGDYILYKSDCSDTEPSGDGFCDGKDNFGIMRADFTDARRVNLNGMDVTGGSQGFSQVGHWINTP